MIGPRRGEALAVRGEGGRRAGGSGSWTAASFPANVPLRLQLESRGFTSDVIDFARGGYALANQAQEDIIWNNNYRVWVQRTCP